jgi:hypothetical protein
MLEDPDFYVDTDKKCMRLVSHLAYKSFINTLLRLTVVVVWNIWITFSVFLIIKMFHITGYWLCVSGILNSFGVIYFMHEWLKIANHRSRFIKRALNIDYSPAYSSEIRLLAEDMDNEFETGFAVYWVNKYV